MKPALATSVQPTRVRHVILAITVAVYMITYMDRVIISTALPVMRQELGFSLITAGWILSSFRWAYALRLFDTSAQRFALDIWHGVVQHAARFTGAEDGNDVRMLQIGRQMDLTDEALDVDAARHFRREHLDDDTSA